VIDTNLKQTNQLLKQLIELIRRGFSEIDEREQENIEYFSTTTIGQNILNKTK
jgi:hypothetical protein